jgi:hypothetical protein
VNEKRGCLKNRSERAGEMLCSLYEDANVFAVGSAVQKHFREKRPAVPNTTFATKVNFSGF